MAGLSRAGGGLAGADRGHRDRLSLIPGAAERLDITSRRCGLRLIGAGRLPLYNGHKPCRRIESMSHASAVPTYQSGTRSIPADTAGTPPETRAAALDFLA